MQNSRTTLSLTNANPPTVYLCSQDIYDALEATFTVVICHENRLSPRKLKAFMRTVGDGVGVAATYNPKSVLKILAIATSTHVLVLKMKTCPKSVPQKETVPRKLLSDTVLCNPAILKYAFEMDKLSLSLFQDLNLRISSGIDLLSVSTDDAGRESLAALKNALGGELHLNIQSVKRVFKLTGGASIPIQDIALQAWAAFTAASLPDMLARHAKTPRQLKMISNVHRLASRLTALKPTRVTNEINPDYVLKNGQLNVLSSRYKTRITSNIGQAGITTKIQVDDKGVTKTLTTRVTERNGRAATLPLKTGEQCSITSITTVGREKPTAAETLRAQLLLRVIQGSISLFDNAFVKAIWFPPEPLMWPEVKASQILGRIHFPSPRNLNASQTKAVHAILSQDDQNRVVLIHGPPGTGKTTVIAASVTSIMGSTIPDATMWLVAQSNVAVKNIAEKLAAVEFLDFRILVSKEFHYGWHEHLYEKVEQKLIRSDEFVTNPLSTERRLGGSRVILCTVGMLSNSSISSITRVVPPKVLIFDEASQIEIGAYLPVLHLYNQSLEKLVFIGDDKQLAPFGKEHVKNLESVFEKGHLRQRAIMLDIQYRMPMPIGNFISENVYDGLLKSQHPIFSETSVRFVDMSNGMEERDGKANSYMNTREIQACISLARIFHSHGMSYRIITPYDLQRSRLENGLKGEDLPWEDKCFNIDAFQGNEADYIIISLVRSAKLGFLVESRRVNVMLTRCKMGMVICTSRQFIEDIATIRLSESSPGS